jgi:hypothetical protein
MEFEQDEVEVLVQAIELFAVLDECLPVVIVQRVQSRIRRALGTPPSSPRSQVVVPAAAATHGVSRMPRGPPRLVYVPIRSFRYGPSALAAC